MKGQNVYDNAQKLVNEFERKYPAIAVQLNKEQLLTAALMSTFTKMSQNS